MDNVSRPAAPFFTFFILLFTLTFSCSLGFAEEFYCEVMSVEGTATLSNNTVSGKPLQEGDLLKVDDLVEVSSGSSVDLAYDSEWNNITRVEENSRVRLRSIYPTEIDLEEGGIFAQLKSLPKDSTFDVKTPTAIASVRGTEYRTTFLSGETQIYNVSNSDVYVFGLDDNGNQQPEPVILTRSQATQVQKRGLPPVAPRRMEERDFQPVKRFQQGIDRKIQDNVAKGRFGKIQDVKTVERMHEEGRAIGKEGRAMNRREGRETGRGGDENGKPRIMTGDEASAAAGRLRGEEPRADEPGPERFGAHGEPSGQPNESGALRSDESGKRPSPQDHSHEQRSGMNKETASRRGLAEPFFPGNEEHRGGGPEPVNFPEERWKSGAENKGGGPEQGGFERQPHGSMGQQKEHGANNSGQGPKREPNQPKNQNQGKSRPGPQKRR